MHFRRVLFTTLVWVSLMGCLPQGGPTGSSPSGGSPGGGLLNPGGTTGGANPGSSIVDPLSSTGDGGPAAATQDPASTGVSPDGTQATPPDRPPSTAVPDPILCRFKPSCPGWVGPDVGPSDTGNGEGGFGSASGEDLMRVGQQVREAMEAEQEQQQEEHEEFMNELGENLQSQGLGMQEPASEEEMFPVVSAPAPLSSSGGQILQRESFLIRISHPTTRIRPNNIPTLEISATVSNNFLP